MSCVVALVCLVIPSQEAVKTPPAAQVLPPSTAAFLEIADPGRLLTTVMEHPLHDRARSEKAIAKAYASPQMLQARAGLAMAELAIGMKLPDAVNALAGAGIAVAFDPETNGAVAIIRSGDQAKFAALTERLLKFAGEQREKNNQPEMKSAEYRDIRVYQLDGAVFAILNDALVISSQKNLGRWVVDAILDRPDETFASTEAYKRASAGRDNAVTARAIVNLDVIRNQGGVEALQEATRSNPAAEFLLGGVYENLLHAPFVIAELTLDDKGATLAARTPHDAEWIGEEREFFFGPEGGGKGPARVPVESTILNVSTYRDISKMWLFAGDLFDQEVNDGFAQAETTLSTFFAGKDFVEEILGEIQPNWQFIVARQDFENVLPRPALRLPSFAIVGELKDPGTMGPELKRIFQSTVGFFNVVGAMEGNPQLDQDIAMEGDVKFLTSSFVPTPEDRESTTASVHYNFSPSVAFRGDHFVLSSSLDLARKVVAGLDRIDEAEDRANFTLQFKAKTLQQALTDNRGQLISNNMIEEGSTRAEAETQIDLLLRIVGWFDEFSATMQPTDDELRLQLRLSLED